MTIEEFNRRLSLISGGMDYTEPMKLIGEEVVKSIRRNFQEGGRPEAWQQSIRAKKGYKTLIETGTLMRSIAVGEVTWNSVTVGTNVPYAQIHNEGGDIVQKPKVNAHKRTGRFASKDKLGESKKKSIRISFSGARTIHIPPRPFLVVQPEDITMAQKILSNFIVKKITTGV